MYGDVCVEIDDTVCVSVVFHLLLFRHQQNNNIEQFLIE